MDAPEMLHQTIKFLERRPAISLEAFSDQSEFLENCDSVVELLPGKGIAPRRSGNCENIGKVREIVAAGLRFDIFAEFASKRHQRMAGQVAAFDLAKTAVLGGFEDLGLGSEDRVLGFGDIAVDHRRKGRVFFLFEAAGALELGFALYDPTICRLLAVEGLGLAVGYSAAFFMTI